MVRSLTRLAAQAVSPSPVGLTRPTIENPTGTNGAPSRRRRLPATRTPPAGGGWRRAGEVHERPARSRSPLLHRHVAADQRGLRLDDDGRVVRRRPGERVVGGGQQDHLGRRHQRESQPTGRSHALLFVR